MKIKRLIGHGFSGKPIYEVTPLSHWIQYKLVRLLAGKTGFVLNMHFDHGLELSPGHGRCLIANSFLRYGVTKKAEAGK